MHENKRIADLETNQIDFQDCTDALKKKDGQMRLYPLQNAALNEAAKWGGGVYLLGCGTGKTLISLLIPAKLNMKKPLLLIPASLRKKTEVEMLKYAEHFNFPTPTLLNYEMLSRASGQSTLKELCPDIIICDEAHYLKDLSSTRTSRLGMYLLENPYCKLFVMSGTLFNKSIADFAHLSDWALEGLSPVPRNPRDVYMWDQLLLNQAEAYMHSLFAPMYKAWGDKDVAGCIHNRLACAGGIILTTDDAVPCSLTIAKRSPALPKELRETIKQVLQNETPMSEILSGVVDEDLEPLNASQHLWDNPDQVLLHTLGQLAAGMLYYWKWEAGPDEEWLLARKMWRKAVSLILECAVPEFDSPALIFDNFYALPPELINNFESSYLAWGEQRHKKEPPREVIWISDYLIQDVSTWLSAQKSPALIWVNSIALGEKLAEQLKIPYYGGGTEFDTSVAHSCILSVDSHGTGKNLQAWSNNLVVAPIASPQIWEQMIARTHRTGQMADTVNFTVYTTSVFGSTFRNAVRQAEIVGATTGQTQRIVYADKIS